MEYHGFSNKIVLFYCDWFDPTNNSGTRVNNEYNIVDIKMNKRYRQYDPFILSQEAKHMYYVPYRDMWKNMQGWYARITTKPKDYVEIDITEDEIPYQSDEMSQVVPIIEQMWFSRWKINWWGRAINNDKWSNDSRLRKQWFKLAEVLAQQILAFSSNVHKNAKPTIWYTQMHELLTLLNILMVCQLKK